MRAVLAHYSETVRTAPKLFPFVETHALAYAGRGQNVPFIKTGFADTGIVPRAPTTVSCRFSFGS